MGCAHLLLLAPWLCVGRCLRRPFLGSACRAFISAALNGRWQSSQRRRGRETRFCCSAPRPAAFLLRYENGSSFQLGKALLSVFLHPAGTGMRRCSGRLSLCPEAAVLVAVIPVLWYYLCFVLGWLQVQLQAWLCSRRVIAPFHQPKPFLIFFWFSIAFVWFFFLVSYGTQIFYPFHPRFGLMP